MLDQDSVVKIFTTLSHEKLNDPKRIKMKKMCCLEKIREIINRKRLED
jgi:hypothetical protein